MKCQACRSQQAEWSWQPFGPGEGPDVFTSLGSHYRGFPIIKVCDSCKRAFQSGDFEVRFTYKGYHYVGRYNRVMEEKISLFVGGNTSLESLGQGKGTLLMKDAPDEMKLVAVVTDSSLVTLLSASSDLLEACKGIDKLSTLLERLAETFLCTKEERLEVLLALGKVSYALQEAGEKPCLKP